MLKNLRRNASINFMIKQAIIKQFRSHFSSIIANYFEAVRNPAKIVSPNKCNAAFSIILNSIYMITANVQVRRAFLLLWSRFRLCCSHACHIKDFNAGMKRNLSFATFSFSFATHFQISQDFPFLIPIGELKVFSADF